MVEGGETLKYNKVKENDKTDSKLKDLKIYGYILSSRPQLGVILLNFK